MGKCNPLVTRDGYEPSRICAVVIQGILASFALAAGFLTSMVSTCQIWFRSIYDQNCADATAKLIGGILSVTTAGTDVFAACGDGPSRVAPVYKNQRSDAQIPVTI